MAQAHKPDFFFRRNGRVHLNLRDRQFSRLLAAEVCASAVVMLDKPCSEVLWRVLATHSIRQFPLHFPSRASPCAIAFQLDSTSHIKPLRVREAYTMGCRAPLHSWDITAPKATPLASVCNINISEILTIPNTGGCEMVFFKASKASCCSGLHTNLTPFCAGHWKGPRNQQDEV